MGFKCQVGYFYVVWLLAGKKGKKEYLLFVFLFLLLPIKDNRPNPHSLPRRILKVRHSFSDAHFHHKGKSSGKFCEKSTSTEPFFLVVRLMAPKARPDCTFPFSLSVLCQTWAASSLEVTIPLYFLPPNGCLRQSWGPHSSSCLGTGVLSLYFRPSKIFGY